MKPIKTAEEVDAKKLSAQTPGFAGAEIVMFVMKLALSLLVATKGVS